MAHPLQSRHPAQKNKNTKRDDAPSDGDERLVLAGHAPLAVGLVVAQPRVLGLDDRAQLVLQRVRGGMRGGGGRERERARMEGTESGRVAVGGRVEGGEGGVITCTFSSLSGCNDGAGVAAECPGQPLSFLVACVWPTEVSWSPNLCAIVGATALNLCRARARAATGGEASALQARRSERGSYRCNACAFRVHGHVCVCEARASCAAAHFAMVVTWPPSQPIVFCGRKCLLSSAALPRAWILRSVVAYLHARRGGGEGERGKGVYMGRDAGR